jgi:hypothetical protein
MLRMSVLIWREEPGGANARASNDPSERIGAATRSAVARLMITTIRAWRSAAAWGAPLIRAQPLFSGRILIRDGSGGKSILGPRPARQSGRSLGAG